ncbi:MAG: histidinol-phosphate transaminase [Tannerellaceae bacterium]|jgi:histidinol-phosphate aminotransferase|nr:histidinol-phosphate transaminase [Tannerellaceae bacterium]
MSTISSLLRSNIRNLKPYSSARDEFQGKATINLDANENPFNVAYARYPDPLQRNLRQRIAKMKSLSPEQIFTGNGSDEAIDLVIRAFCEPGSENLIALTPSYGMYKVAADINNVECRQVELATDGATFSLNSQAVLDVVDKKTKVIFLCSPNNPTGNLLDKAEIYRILDNFKGVVVVDEAYLDFSLAASLSSDLGRYPRLIVLQTLSKAWGAAGMRLGMAFANREIIGVLNQIKYPYNINQLTQTYAIQRLFSDVVMKDHVKEIIAERTALAADIQKQACVKHVYPSDANFLLVKVTDAETIYKGLVAKKIVVRNRHSLPLCENCLRITIGTPAENKALLDALKHLSK